MNILLQQVALVEAKAKGTFRSMGIFQRLYFTYMGATGSRANPLGLSRLIMKRFVLAKNPKTVEHRSEELPTPRNGRHRK